VPSRSKEVDVEKLKKEVRGEVEEEFRKKLTALAVSN
jgi:hypothetical protein